MEGDLFRRLAVDFSLGDRHALEDGKGVRFDKGAQVAGLKERTDFGMGATVRRILPVRVPVGMMMGVAGISMRVASFVFFGVMPVPAASARRILIVPMGRPFMNAKSNAFDGLALLALEVHVEIAQVELGEFPLKGGRFDAEIAKRPNGHIAADAGNAVEKENTHGVHKSRKRAARKAAKTPRWRRDPWTALFPDRPSPPPRNVPGSLQTGNFLFAAPADSGY